jgi:hypothetical protein
MENIIKFELITNMKNRYNTKIQHKNKNKNKYSVMIILPNENI